MKFSEDGSEYETELFDSKKDAKGELDEILIASGDSKELYRIVDDSIQEETNLYYWPAMKIKPFKIEVEKPKPRKPPLPPNKTMKDKKQYNRKDKYSLSFLQTGYEL